MHKLFFGTVSFWKQAVFFVWFAIYNTSSPCTVSGPHSPTFLLRCKWVYKGGRKKVSNEEITYSTNFTCEYLWKSSNGICFSVFATRSMQPVKLDMCQSFVLALETMWNTSFLFKIYFMLFSVLKCFFCFYAAVCFNISYCIGHVAQRISLHRRNFSACSIQICFMLLKYFSSS